LHETFTDISIHFKNLFVAVSKAELINKPTSHTVDQEVFSIKTFYCSDGYRIGVDGVLSIVVCVARSRSAIGLLNNLKIEEACVINVLRYLNVEHMSLRQKLYLQHARQ
jgi:hypothetical protein